MDFSFLRGSLASLFIPLSFFVGRFGLRGRRRGRSRGSGVAPPACDSSKDKRFDIIFSNTIASGIAMASWSALTKAATSLELDAMSSVSS